MIQFIKTNIPSNIDRITKKSKIKKNREKNSAYQPQLTVALLSFKQLLHVVGGTPPPSHCAMIEFQMICESFGTRVAMKNRHDF